MDNFEKQMTLNFQSTIEKNYQSDKEFVENHIGGTECPYCEKKRDTVSLWGSIDNEFDYCCYVCNLESGNWMEGKDKHSLYGNPDCDKSVKEALKRDRDNNDIQWRPNLKTIAERCEIFRPVLAAALRERKGNE